MDKKSLEKLMIDLIKIAFAGLIILLVLIAFKSVSNPRKKINIKKHSQLLGLT